jgi:hypothetical protein
MEEHEGRAVATFGSGSRDTGQLDLVLHDGHHRQRLCTSVVAGARSVEGLRSCERRRIAHTALMTLALMARAGYSRISVPH